MPPLTPARRERNTAPMGGAEGLLALAHADTAHAIHRAGGPPLGPDPLTTHGPGGCSPGRSIQQLWYARIAGSVRPSIAAP